MRALLLLLLLWRATATAAERPEQRVSPTALRVRAAPDRKSAIVGQIARNAPFWVLGYAAGEGCSGDGWGIVERGGYACLSDTVVTADPVLPVGRLVPFDAPTPDEYRAYVKTGAWPRDEANPEALLPYVYGKAWRHWKGTLYESAEAFEAGEPPTEQLEDDRKYHFVAVRDTEKGTVLVRDDGTVVPLADTFVYPVSRFSGVDLEVDPLPEGLSQAWVWRYEGAKVYAGASRRETEVAALPYQTALRVRATPDPAWYEVPASGGFVEAKRIRVATPLPPPEGIAAGETWVDVDLSQQILTLMRGTEPFFVTLVSSGLTDLVTPPGVYRLRDKGIAGDMASLPDAPEPYHVEAVPWVMHFRPRYALHGTFWHWGFGNRASHGCVNLSPRDARRVFDAVTPQLPDGWERVEARTDGTVIRIREGDAPVRDRR